MLVVKYQQLEFHVASGQAKAAAVSLRSLDIDKLREREREREREICGFTKFCKYRSIAMLVFRLD